MVTTKQTKALRALAKEAARLCGDAELAGASEISDLLSFFAVKAVEIATRSEGEIEAYERVVKAEWAEADKVLKKSWPVKNL